MNSLAFLHRSKYFFPDSSVTLNFPGCKRYDLCTKRDKGLFVDLVYFQLQDVNLTPEQESRFLKKVLEQERKDTELFKQQEAVRNPTPLISFLFKNQTTMDQT